MLFTCHSTNNQQIFLILEPEAGFRIAFNMYDTDGNQRVDKEEFLVVSTRFVFLTFSMITKIFKNIKSGATISVMDLRIYIGMHS